MSAGLMILRGIATLLVNPALGGGSNLGVARASFLLNLFANIIEGGDAMAGEMEKLAAEIQAMIDANGSPTKEQWASMEARDKAARDAIAANLAALDAPPTPQETAQPTTEKVTSKKTTSRKKSQKESPSSEPIIDTHL